MKVIHCSEAPARRFEGGPAENVTGRVLIGKNDGARGFCMRLFELGPGGHTPRHEHEWEHEIFIHSGEGRVLRNGEWVPVKEGSAVFIPGHEEHQLKNTGDKPFVFVCLIPAGPDEL